MRPYAVVSDQVRVEALAYGRCSCVAARLSALVAGLGHVEVPVADRNAEEFPSPAWVAGKTLASYWLDS